MGWKRLVAFARFAATMPLSSRGRHSRPGCGSARPRAERARSPNPTAWLRLKPQPVVAFLPGINFKGWTWSDFEFPISVRVHPWLVPFLIPFSAFGHVKSEPFPVHSRPNPRKMGPNRFDFDDLSPTIFALFCPVNTTALMS
jgi:hypothetical protein